MAEQSKNRLFQLVRRFSDQSPSWGEAIRYHTKPDERFDITLVSARVYGRRAESLVIQAAAGLDSPELEMSERMLILPTPSQLKAMKRQAGFSDAEIL